MNGLILVAALLVRLVLPLVALLLIGTWLNGRQSGQAEK
jgi:hypothetical protein